MRDLEIRIQILRNKMKQFIKFTTVLIAFYFTSCINSAEPEMHLLPKNFQGYVIIVFDDQNGQDEKYEDGFRVYEIPSNGVLKTKFKSQHGWIANDKLKYYYDSNGLRENVSYIEFEKDTKDSMTTYVHRKELSENCVRYLVSPLSKSEKYYEEMNKKLDELFPPIVQ